MKILVKKMELNLETKVITDTKDNRLTDTIKKWKEGKKKMKLLNDHWIKIEKKL